MVAITPAAAEGTVTCQIRRGGGEGRIEAGEEADLVEEESRPARTSSLLCRRFKERNEAHETGRQDKATIRTRDQQNLIE